jgi:hypothetical protein
MTKDEALKLALDALITEYHMERSSFAKRVYEIFEQALAAPVQEPVAWRWKRDGGEWQLVYQHPRSPTAQPLYATPPAAQRQWVGLTEQEAAECWSTGTVRTWQAIEAKLKEKNT